MAHYKVVYRETDRLESYAGVATIVYEVGKWTRPQIKGSKLFVFDNLQDAKTFDHGAFRLNPCRAIYRCHVRGIEKGPRKWIAYCVEEDVRSYWRGAPSRRMSSPKGTVCVGAVKLVERVY